MHTIGEISKVIQGNWLSRADEAAAISLLVYDTRNIEEPSASLFFALHTSHADGHRFITDAYKKGVRNFVVSEDVQALADSNVIRVGNTLTALQTLAAWHRSLFNISVIGITGSNGKTIVKEWLYELLHFDKNIVRSPKSYNSQIGVPVSVWQLNEQHELGIFEAGISRAGEMPALENIIRPTIGVITNLGEAHSEGFASSEEKLQEKLSLFIRAEIVIGPQSVLKDLKKDKLTWGETADSDLRILNRQTGNETLLSSTYRGNELRLNIPFSDAASVENALTCTAVLLYLNYDIQTINERLSKLHAVDMRLQLKHGINHTVIINDSYSADLTSLGMALNFTMQQKTGQKRTVILSDIVESGKKPEVLYAAVAEALIRNGISGAVLIGKEIGKVLPSLLPSSFAVKKFDTTDDFIRDFHTSWFSNETILIKGARKFGFEKIAALLETKLHQTRLEIDLNAIAHNFKQYQKFVKPGTKFMAMVKAFAYGSGTSEIASVLQHNHVDFLGVAYADEGVDLRRAGITIPIMVMNADDSSFDAITQNKLAPVLYSFDILDQFRNYLEANQFSAYPIHIEVETGMNRLGFASHEIPSLAEKIAASGELKLVSVFSHLAASEDPAQDDFTNEQAEIFEKIVSQLQLKISYPFLKHIANSAAIIRHPHLQLDMVRLGIGLYGIEPGDHRIDLKPVANLRTTISQIKFLKAGETVSYNRLGIIKEDSVIATVRIGYADGYSRRFGNGIGKMLVNGHLAPVVGTVCMDMTMINITGIDGVNVGDEVLVFGEGLPVEKLAGWAETIPYEIMTSVSHRVKRIYYQE